jgi:hypothetical protein
MAARTYHDFLARMGAGLLAWGLAVAAVAGQLRLGDMLVTYDAAWQRGDPAEEAELDSLILRLVEGEGAEADELTLYLSRRAAPIQEDAGRFRDQLALKWRALYGAEARIEPRTLDGRDWFTCRRPSRDGRDTVFQWVTLEAGLAYNLVWFGAGPRESLHGEAEVLLHGVAFPARGAEVAEAPAEAGPTPTPPAPRSAAPADPESPRAPLALPAAAPETSTDSIGLPVAAPVADGGAGTHTEATEVDIRAPALALPEPPAGRWRMARVIVARPSSSVLDAMAQLDAMRLPPGSHMTGHGLQSDAQDLAWFLDGFRWEPGPPGPEEGGPRELKVPFRQGGRVRWEGLPTRLGNADVVPLRLLFSAGPGETAGRFGLRLQWLEICASDTQRQRAYAHLARGRHASLGRLLKQRHKACPEAAAQALPEPVQVLSDPAGAASDKVIPLAVPRPAELPLEAPGVRRVLVLAARPFASAAEDQPGDGLLRQAGVYYLYVPER